jgi:stringent starvation protein B
VHAKLEIALELLQGSWVEAHLDPRVAGVALPGHLRDQSALVLPIGRDLAVDLVVDEAGFTCTLWFSGKSFQCAVPWRSVFALVSEQGAGKIWEEDIPLEIAQRRDATAIAAWDAWSAEVDALAGLGSPRPSAEPTYRTPGRAALRGRWIGCSVRPAAAFRPVCMDLELDLRGDPSTTELVGDGADPVGRFTVQGPVDTFLGLASFQKRYQDGVTIAHSGRSDGVALRGVWERGDERGVFVLYRASAFDADTVDALGRRARGLLSPVETALASLTAPFRFAVRAQHQGLLERFRTLIL